MDKKIILAVAGSGKTTYLVDHIPENKRSLVLTYTDSNNANLRKGILTRFGFFPEYIRLQTYFSFLYSFCIQPFLMFDCKLNGLTYKPNKNMYAKGDRRYLTNSNRLYHYRAAKFIEEKNLYNNIQKRLEKYYQYLYIDEIQDFAGHDFNLLKCISQSNVNILYVGDFFQHTFDTSRDGTVNQNLHKNYKKYKEEFRKIKFDVDEKTLNKSYRCCPRICEYITDNLNIHIESHKAGNAKIIYIDDNIGIDNLMKNNNIIKLFYQEHYAYNCKSRNWGDCKGENKYEDVCVILNGKTVDYYIKNKLKELPSQTLNKLYVAISRAHRDVYFIAEKNVKNYRKRG
jgi:ATP-dependent exoDNAse (exonuclease V) beta subunit